MIGSSLHYEVVFIPFTLFSYLLIPTIEKANRNMTDFYLILSKDFIDQRDILASSVLINNHLVLDLVNVQEKSWGVKKPSLWILSNATPIYITCFGVIYNFFFILERDRRGWSHKSQVRTKCTLFTLLSFTCIRARPSKSPNTYSRIFSAETSRNFHPSSCVHPNAILGLIFVR